MKVLLVGGGGREHALARAIAASPRLDRLFCLPGNGGTAEIGVNLPGDAEDPAQVLAAAKAQGADLTVVGPEAPLCAGVVDAFVKAGMRIFGPSRAAARLEADKAYAKTLMRRAQVPTAEARVFDRYDAARTYVATRDYALVVKASGLAAGKGVVVCDDPSEGLLALEKIMVERQFGDAGKIVVVEERLTGPEVSVLAIIDDRTIYLLETARDYKRAGDGDFGPNTGGMGAVSPAPGVDDALLDEILRHVFIPIIDVLRTDGVTYHGILYAGIMLTAAGPKVLEFNCRFGDPEAQVVIPRLRCDMLEVLDACAVGRLDQVQLGWDPRPAVCVVMASGGYPGKYEKGKLIGGLDAAASMNDVIIYHAGTQNARGSCLTSGGRVLGVTALGDDVNAARTRAYEAVSHINFEGAMYRRDIAAS